MKKLLFGVIAALAVTGCGGDGDEPAAEKIRAAGSLLIDGGSYLRQGSSNLQTKDDGSCAGSNGFSDIDAGASVTIYDNTDKIVGTGTLSSGVLVGNVPEVMIGACTWSFAIDDLPESDFYQVEVANRGRVTKSRAEIGDIRLSLDNS